MFIDLRELSRRTGLSRRTLRSWVADPVRPLPAFQVGSKLLFKWEEVTRWFEGHRVAVVDLEGLAADVTAALSGEASDEEKWLFSGICG